MSQPHNFCLFLFISYIPTRYYYYSTTTLMFRCLPTTRMKSSGNQEDPWECSNLSVAPLLCILPLERPWFHRGRIECKTVFCVLTHCNNNWTSNNTMVVARKSGRLTIIEEQRMVLSNSVYWEAVSGKALFDRIGCLFLLRQTQCLRGYLVLGGNKYWNLVP
jgi:hypothetical protein